MAYYTGSASSGSDMLAQLANSLDLEGWTIHTNEMLTGGRWICVQPPDIDEYTQSPLNFNFRYNTEASSLPYTVPEHLYLYGNDGGYSSAAAWDDQPGNPGSISNRLSNFWSAPINAYWFFISDHYCYVVCQDGNGYYHHAAVYVWNETTAIVSQDSQAGRDAYTDRFTSSRHNRIFGSTITSSNNNYPNTFYRGGSWTSSTSQAGCAISYSWEYSTTGTIGLSNGMWRAAENASTVTTPLIPAVVTYNDVSGNGIALPTVGDFRYTNIRYLEAGDTFTFGTDEWILFPCVRKTNFTTTGDELPNSYWGGYAYKK